MASNLWLSFAFLTASVLATLSLLDKVVLDQETSTPFVTASLNAVPKFGIFVLAALAVGNVAPSPDTLSLAAVGPILLASGIGAINVFSVTITYRGMEQTDVSRFIPLLNTDVVFVLALGAVFLGESFALPVYLGVAVIFIGTMLISLEDVSSLQIISREALTFGLTSAFVIALVSLLLKFLTPLLGLYSILFWFGLGGITTVGLAATWKHVRGSLGGEEDVSVMSPGSISIMIGGVVTAVSYFTLVWALNSGPVTIVTAIVNLEVLLVFFGVLVLTKFTPEVLQEPMDRGTLAQKFTASVLMLGGVVIIQLFS